MDDLDTLQKEMARTFNEFRSATDKYLAAIHASKIDKTVRAAAMTAAAALEQGVLIQLELAQALREREERLKVLDRMN